MWSVVIGSKPIGLGLKKLFILPSLRPPFMSFNPLNSI